MDARARRASDVGQAEAKAHEQEKREVLVKEWLRIRLPHALISSDDNLHDLLQDGNLLCQLIEGFGSSLLPPCSGAPGQSGQALANIDRFLIAVTKLGVPENNVFSSQDLLTGTGMSRVVSCLLYLAFLVRGKQQQDTHGTAGTDLASMTPRAIRRMLPRQGAMPSPLKMMSPTGSPKLITRTPQGLKWVRKTPSTPRADRDADAVAGEAPGSVGRTLRQHAMLPPTTVACTPRRVLRDTATVVVKDSGTQVTPPHHGQEEVTAMVDEDDADLEVARYAAAADQRAAEAAAAREVAQAEAEAKEQAEAALAAQREKHQASILEVRQLLKTLRSDFDAMRGMATLQMADFGGSLHDTQNKLMPAIASTQQAYEQRVVEMSQQVEQQSDTITKLSSKYSKELKKRKDLFNQLQDLRGNIRVMCRVRPRSASEEAAGHKICTDFPDDDQLDLFNPDSSTGNVFEFDRVFGPSSTQQDVYAEVDPLVTSVLDGYNVCIFAYGQTGSGKTYTMEGPEGDRGVNHRALDSLFQVINERRSIGTYEYAISVHLIEIYNETVRDLLVEPGKDRGISHEIRLSKDKSGPYVENLSERECGCLEDMLEVIEQGHRNRTVKGTNMNERSSRSHCVLQVNIRGRCIATDTSIDCKLNLVDLAGSERVSRSGAEGDRLKEAQHINKSLSALGDVIASFLGKAKHVPYRNSKLTHLLQTSLSGASKTMMFVQISPVLSSYRESLCSLNFAARVRSVEMKTGPGARARPNAINDDKKYRHLVARLKSKDGEIEAAQQQAQRMAEAVAEEQNRTSMLAAQLAQAERALAIAQETAVRMQKDMEEQQTALLKERRKHANMISQVQAEKDGAAATAAKLRKAEQALRRLQSQASAQDSGAGVGLGSGGGGVPATPRSMRAQENQASMANQQPLSQQQQQFVPVGKGVDAGKFFGQGYNDKAAVVASEPTRRETLMTAPPQRRTTLAPARRQGHSSSAGAGASAPSSSASSAVAVSVATAAAVAAVVSGNSAPACKSTAASRARHRSGSTAAAGGTAAKRTAMNMPLRRATSSANTSSSRPGWNSSYKKGTNVW